MLPNRPGSKSRKRNRRPSRPPALLAAGVQPWKSNLRTGNPPPPPPPRLEYALSVCSSPWPCLGDQSNGPSLGGRDLGWQRHSFFVNGLPQA
ncbi:hypothetical protein CORC01_09742 [Colletotrichum orchidophilum]|uniref:Uncharacterized protein n=1 Tax=Colletotrichum orchidophilum TaxID=1209926 RepID=A0A1G4B0J9_9PEZI|nr:uncharacterized protein CORC01_09742 [Colletotrichum orchidophilum]OHE94948.1 hypothetical protein CORC01_09742 [Colletotrichum orchidophilum]